MKKIIATIIFFLLIFTLSMTSCSKKENNEIIDNTPDSLSYMSTVMDIYKTKPMANMKGYVIFHTEIYSGQWWNNNATSTTIHKVLDSFFTDSAGHFSFTLYKNQLQDFYGTYLTFVVPENYQPLEIKSEYFYKMVKNSITPIEPWGYILVNFKNFGYSKTACDYCWVDVCRQNDTLKLKSLTRWSYGDLPPQGYYAKVSPGQYLLKAQYACGNFRGDELMPIIIKGHDTIELKSYLHY